MKQTDDEKREQILVQCTAMFFKYGISRLTMDEIASRQGISKKTLYRFFPNKAGLLEEVMKRQMNLIGDRIKAVTSDKELEFTAKISSVLEIVTVVISRLGDDLVKDLYRGVPDQWTRIEQFRAEFVLKPIAELIYQGVDSGYVRNDVDPKIVVPLFLNTLQSVMTPEQFIKIPFPVIDVFKTLIRILFGGILTEGTRQQLFERLDAAYGTMEVS